MNLDDTALITHRGCPDGSGCAIAFITAGGNPKNIYFANPGHEEVEELLEDVMAQHDGPILIADASLSLKYVKANLYKLNNDITIIDHHKSAIPLNQFDWCHIDEENNACGSKLLHQFLLNHCDGQTRVKLMKLNNLLEYIDNYDRWVDPKGSESYIVLHRFLGQDLFIERFVHNPLIDLEAREEYAISIEIAKKNKYIDQKVKEAVIVNKPLNGGSVDIALVETSKNQSEIGNRLCTLNADVAVMVNSTSVSFRGSYDCPIDLSEVADINGGGGHKSASGTKISNLLGEDFAQFIFNKIKWRKDEK